MNRSLSYIEKAFIYGCLGLCIEVWFTAIAALARGSESVALQGQTYLWMMPVWAVGMFALGYARSKASHYRIVTRGVIYAAVCFATEYSFGMLYLLTLREIPWDYTGAAWSIHGAIRLDYFVWWFLAGLASEKVIAYVNRLRLQSSYPPTSY